MKKHILTCFIIISVLLTACSVIKNDEVSVNELPVPENQQNTATGTEKTIAYEAGSDITFDKAEIKSEEISENSPEGTSENKSEVKTEDKYEDNTEDRSGDKSEDNSEDKSEDKLEDNIEDKSGDKTGDMSEDKPETKPENTPDGNSDKYIDIIEEQQIIYTVPVVNIYTDDGEPVVSRTEYKHCEIFTSNVEEENMLYCAPAQIRTRGNSTDYYGDEDKARTVPVPYRIKFDEKCSFLGLNDGAKCRNWVLLKTNWNILTDDIAFGLGRIMLEDGNYCSDSKIVHVFVNGEDRGLYTACEQTQVNKNRINIYECPKGYEGTDIGYLVEIDNYWEDPYFTMFYSKETVTDINGKTMPFRRNAYSIKSDIYSTDQKRFITQYITGTFDVLSKAILHGEFYELDERNQLVEADQEKLRAEDNEGCTNDAELVISQLLDLDSVVDTYLLHEIVMSYDIGEGSFFMCVDFSKDSTCKKLRFTSPWDFNWTLYENPGGYGCYAGTFWDDELIKKYGERYHPWYIILMTQEWFRNRVCDRWEELQNTGLIQEFLDAEKEMIQNYRSDIEKTEKFGTYYKSAQKLISDTEKRIAWMDETYIQNRCENILKTNDTDEPQISSETSADPLTDK